MRLSRKAMVMNTMDILNTIWDRGSDLKERLREQWEKCEEAMMNHTGTFLEEHAKLTVIIEEAEKMGYSSEQISEMCYGKD